MQEGAGVTIQRTIGTPECPNLDPFLMLDHFSSDNPDDYLAGFPSHPHRGFITLTYMLDGHMLHEDHMGNRGNLVAGGVQWMKAARGVIHSEKPQQENGLMRGFQLWINLPGHEKMSDPEYQEFKPESIPVIHEADKTIKLISGVYRDVTGPVNDPNSGVFYLDMDLKSGAVFEYPVPVDANVFVFVYDGELTISGDRIGARHLAILGAGDSLVLTAGDPGAKAILVGGLPIREPIVQYGPFVMNSREEIQQAILEFTAGKLTEPS
jgi:hypothetical protein